MMNKIENSTFEEERALYHLKDTVVKSCTFAGEQDGESSLKEARNVVVEDSHFSLRYPLWHAQKYALIRSTINERSRAPIWYSHDGVICQCRISGIKAFRECTHLQISDSVIDSKEFGWRCRDMEIHHTRINAEYLLFEGKNVTIDHLEMTGKYSFQYMNHVTITDSRLDTKDAFWHSKDIVVENSIVKGEYLGWFSENLTLKNCKIIGTQPLCYAKNLTLIDCEMIHTDFAFEYSDVTAEIKGSIDSVKNPKSGMITADGIGKIIKADSIMEDTCVIRIRKADGQGQR